MVIIINACTLFPRDNFLLEKTYPGNDLFDVLLGQVIQDIKQKYFSDADVYVFSNNENVLGRCRRHEDVSCIFISSEMKDEVQHEIKNGAGCSTILPKAVADYLFKNGLDGKPLLVLNPQLGEVTRQKFENVFSTYQKLKKENVAVVSTIQLDSLNHPSWCYKVEPDINGIRNFAEDERTVDYDEPQRFVAEPFQKMVPLRANIGGSQFLPRINRLEMAVSILTLNDSSQLQRIIPAPPADEKSSNEKTDVFVYSLPVFCMDRQSVIDVQ